MSEILDGVMFNKDVTHTGMKRRIENPRFAISMYIIPYNTYCILSTQSLVTI